MLIKPFLKVFGEYWNNNEYSKFIKIIIRLNLVLIACGVLGEIVCYFIGIPFLNMLYKVDLSEYRIHLLLMVLSGLFYAMSTIMFYVLGTIRKQKLTTIIYSLASVFALVVSCILVKDNIIMGATISNLLIMLFLFIGLTIAFIFSFRKHKKEESIGN